MEHHIDRTKFFHHRNNHPRPNTSPSSFSEMPLSISLSQQSWLPRRPSVPSTSSPPVVGHSKLKGKDRSYDTMDPTSLCTHNIDNIASKSSESSTSSAPYDPSSHSAVLHSHFQQCSGSFPSRHRAGLFSAASDVFGLRKKIGSASRKKPNFSSLSHVCDIVPEVIEINALNNTTVTSTVGGTMAHRDHEHEERERLRDAAAQSIGLDPELLHDSFKSDSRLSLDSPGTPFQPVPIPPFPATLAALRPSTELSATLFKFTPPSSLLVYALSKQWKSRTIVLTSHSASQKTHVHLFKSASKDEKEAERLEVTEDSVIFVAEEEVGGRGNVVKFAGKDVSAKRTGETGEAGTRTMWFLQITDPAESQRWISAIKNAVLTQRAVRAGLDIRAETDGRNEPKGDIDVMLSMHLQGLISPKPIKPSTTMFPSSSVQTSPSPSPSLRSLRINIPSPSPSAMKGMFSGRPRSPSVEGSLTPTHPPGHSEDSFGAAGTNLLTMIRSKSSADFSSSQSHSLPPPLPHAPSPAPSLRLLNSPVVIAASDLKISKERDVPELSTVVPEAISSTTPSSSTSPTPSFSAQGTLALSLQPPPRKSKHAAAAIPAVYLHEQQGMYKQAGGNRSVAGNFGIQSRGSGDDTPRDDMSPASPASSNFSGRISGSLSSNPGFDALSGSETRASEQEDEPNELPSTLGNGTASSSSSGGGSMPSDKLSHSTAITKRWSRQGGPLPKQLVPPSGPPPSIPLSSEENQRSSAESSVYVLANYVADRSPSSSSFTSQSQTRISGSSPLSPTFWKRASSCSTYSVSSTSTDSRGRVPFGSDSLSSLGPVVAKGATGRPMSLLISGSSASGHIKSTKRRSMPPPRPAPNFAPPPAPTAQESTSGPAPLAMHAPVPIKSLRTSVAQRALRLSVTSPKPPPSSALPPRPDEAGPAPRHRRTSSTGTLDLHPAPAPPSRPASALSANAAVIQPASPALRSLSIRQRLRILSTPPVQAPSLHTIQTSTLDLSDENDDDVPTPSVHSPQPFGLGEHITTTQDDPSFLQLSTPTTPTIPKPPPRSPFRPSLTTTTMSSTTSGLSTPPLEPDFDFVSLSPPPPRRGSKPNVVTVTQSEKLEAKGSGSTQREESKLLALSPRGSVVSLGFMTT